MKKVSFTSPLATAAAASALLINSNSEHTTKGLIDCYITTEMIQ